MFPNVAKKLMMEKIKIEGSALNSHFLKTNKHLAKKCHISVAGKVYEAGLIQ
jgi:hypothetical protein